MHTLLPLILACGLATPAVRRHGEVLVQYRHPPTTWSTTQAPAGANVAVVQFDEDKQSFAAAAQALQADPNVLRVEPNLLLWTAHGAKDWTHRDLRDAQGPERAAWTGAAPWALQQGPAVRIGILDTGIDTHHPDLEGSVAAGVNLLSDAQGDEAEDSSAMDYNGHGTQVAGIIGARHNGFGIDGISEASTLVPIKVFDRDGTGSLADVLRAVTWARAQDIQVLNMSFGTYEDSPMLREALQEAASEGMLLVAAAGNDGAGTVTYPAAYPGVLAIGSADGAGISRFSNFGPRVDYYAPGTEVLSTTTRALGPNPYAPLSGTSAAAAHVSGVLAWVLQGGHTGAKALPFLAERSPWRLADRRLGEPRYRTVGTDRILADVQGRALSQLSVLRWDLSSTSSDGALQLSLSVQNTGNAALPGRPLLLRVQGEATQRDIAIATLPALQAGATWSHNMTVQLPKSWMLPGRVALGARLFSRDAPLDAGPRDIVLTPTPAADLAVRAIWLTPFNRVASTQPTVHVRITNPGNAPTPAATLQVSVIAAVHEGIWSVPAEAITAEVPVAPLGPGAFADLQLPSVAPLPASHELTLLAELRDAQGNSLERALQSFSVAPGGQAKLLYNQVAHMGSVQAAVELLRLQKRIIPGIHSGDAPFLGSPETSRDFGGAVRVGASSWRWDWKTDWPAYPRSAKTLVDGASAADGIDVAFGDTGIATWDSHYWVVDENDQASLGKHSAYTKILALMLGGHGSSIEDGAIAAYKAGDAARAWWLVGHAAHLIGDLSTGAHTINRNWHGVVGDPYHDWMGQEGHYRAWPASLAMNGGDLFNLYGTDLMTVTERLRFLTYTTAQIGSSFPWHRSRGWAPSRGAVTGEGNRDIGGDLPHYEQAMQDLFAQFDPHPMTLRDLNSDEVLNGRSVCEAVPHARSNDQLHDCWDGGDGHIDRNNLTLGDKDGDLSRIADASYLHALRAMADLIYLFAAETGQIS